MKCKLTEKNDCAAILILKCDQVEYMYSPNQSFI